MLPYRTYAFFDTETTKLIEFREPNSSPNQPAMIQLAAALTDSQGNILQLMSIMFDTMGKPMSIEAEEVHGISKELADTYGMSFGQAAKLFMNILIRGDCIVGHNIDFDIRMIKIAGAPISRQIEKDFVETLEARDKICTMKSATSLCQLPKPSGRKGFKYPKLEELYKFLFNEKMPPGHDALVDIHATIRCFIELNKRGLYDN